MIDNDEDIELEELPSGTKKINRKKLVIFLLPVLIVIGISVGIFYALNQDYSNTSSYSVVTTPGSSEKGDTVTIFYDLPEISSNLRSNKKNKESITLALSIELSKIEDVAILDAMSSRIKDAILSHIIELTLEEVEGANGLYWLKEELLYRLNLVTSPVKINNLNIKQIEIKTSDN
ncbi:MAG: hypothetical protein E7019_01240 [Alphaproteobacteria bacterium]|nr:hypothetical protein [Alphaproteobacteria bacterium]